MIRINISPDCGNSPKKQFLKELNIAFVKGDSDILIKSVTDKIVWDIIGDRKIEGIENFADELEKMKTLKASELNVNRILTHGKEGAVSGIIKMSNDDRYAFSDFYEFSGVKGAKVSAITSYIIKI